jgi:hypothetical protein
MALGVFEGIADDAFHTLAGIDVFLHGDLVGGALFEYASGIGVDAFRISRMTTKSTSFGSTPFSGHNAASSRRTGRTLA